MASAAALAAAPDAAALVEPEVAALAAEQGRRVATKASSRCCALALRAAVCCRAGVSKPAASATRLHPPC